MVKYFVFMSFVCMCISIFFHILQESFLVASDISDPFGSGVASSRKKKKKKSPTVTHLKSISFT